jgi:predicted ester cyclase
MASDFVRRWLDSYNTRSFPIEDLYTTDCTLTEGGPTNARRRRGPGLFRWLCPDGRNELVSSVESTDRIAIGARFTGTNTGPMGDTLPTDKRVEWPFVVFFDMEDRKAKAHRGYGDQVSLMTQLGLMPGPADV